METAVVILLILAVLMKIRVKLLECDTKKLKRRVNELRTHVRRN
jgi:hypothetical protein